MIGTLEDARNAQLFSGKPLTKFSVSVLILVVLSLIYGLSANAQSVVDGGLTSPEIGGSLGPNLLVNGDFPAGHRRMVAAEQLLQHRSDHAGSQRRRQLADERLGGL